MGSGSWVPAAVLRPLRPARRPSVDRPRDRPGVGLLQLAPPGPQALPDPDQRRGIGRRMRDRVLAEGVVVEHFLRNPQVNYGHPRGAYDALPVATATSLRRVGDRWRMRWRWLEHDPFADRVRNA